MDDPLPSKTIVIYGMNLATFYKDDIFACLIFCFLIFFKTGSSLSLPCRETGKGGRWLEKGEKGGNEMGKKKAKTKKDSRKIKKSKKLSFSLSGKRNIDHCTLESFLTAAAEGMDRRSFSNPSLTFLTRLRSRALRRETLTSWGGGMG